MFLADAKSIRFRESPKEGWDLEKYYGTDQKKVADDILVEHTSYTANNKVGMMACLLALGIFHNTEIQRLFPRKLRSRWLGPDTVSQVFLHGALEASEEDGTTFIFNGQHAKHYEEGLLQVRYVVRLSD
ncbi:unnamed protein product [Trifolium pratense]|uniref:Uncharacterized protein n=1 Tax=Trifolium pratense TaxID=57577 RepID=A0ACB0KJC6_TRIPR|nr:unnamed protein product [Trifolium pratense]